MLLMVGYVRNNAQVSMPLTSQDQSEEELMANYGRAMDKFVDAETFPAVRELIEAGTFQETDDDFSFGLERVLDGIEVLIRKNAGNNPLA